MIRETALEQALGAAGEGCASLASRLVLAAADVAVVLDEEGVVAGVTVASSELARELDASWIGQYWVDTMTADSRAVAADLMRDAASDGKMRWREVFHTTRQGDAVPVRYTVARLPESREMLAVGRDLQAVAAVQQQLAEAQQALERDYWRLRQLETRYRLLFQTATDGVLVVEAGTLKIVEANPVAVELLGERGRGVLGQVFPLGFDAESTQALLGLLGAVRSAGRAEEIRVRLTGVSQELIVSAALLRQENATLYLLRLMPVVAGRETSPTEVMHKLLRVTELGPDAVVLTGPEGRVIHANAAFLDLAQLASEEQARGVSLDHWLGRPGVDLNVLLANLRQHGTVRLFATILRGEYGSSAEVEISAVAVSNAERAGFGFVIRNVGRRVGGDVRPGKELPRSVEQLTELVGRVPLKELVRESTDLIERLCIESALELTGDNRASAAELLGLSRQSLYVKLRRYGISDTATVEEGGS
jgi:transcriptional regulator PpsR